MTIARDSLTKLFIAIKCKTDDYLVSNNIETVHCFVPNKSINYYVAQSKPKTPVKNNVQRLMTSFI